MIHRAFTILSVLSLLLCLAAAVLWVRSYFRHDAVHVLTRRHETLVSSDSGRLMFRRLRENHSERLVAKWIVLDAYGSGDFENTDPWWNRLGFAARGDSVAVRGLVAYSEMTSEIPHWALVLALSLLPILWRRSSFRARPQNAALCPVCGYDLRASKDRCPECGTPIVEAATGSSCL